MSSIKSYKKFSATDYLHEQHDSIEEDDQFIIEFLHNTYKKIAGPGKKLLELGGGPTIYQLLSASAAVDKIIFTDYLAENLKQVNLWKQKKQNAYSWRHYAERVAILEGRATTKTETEHIENRLRKKLDKLLQFDIYQKKMPPIMRKHSFDVVSINFFPEAIATDMASYEKIMRRATNFLKPNGWLVMNMLKNRKHFTNAGRRFHVFPVEEKFMRKILTKIGFKKIEIFTVDVIRTTGPNAIISLRAKK